MLYGKFRNGREFVLFSSVFDKNLFSYLKRMLTYNANLRSISASADFRSLSNETVFNNNKNYFSHHCTLLQFIVFYCKNALFPGYSALLYLS